MRARPSTRPTVPPAFDVPQFARDSDRWAKAAADDSNEKASEVRLATRRIDPLGTNDAWARSVTGVPRVTVTGDALKRLPLDHRAGFLLSLMDGSLDLETIIEVSAMSHDDALALVRDLYDSSIIEFTESNDR
jgi:hypothetical protein